MTLPAPSPDDWPRAMDAQGHAIPPGVVDPDGEYARSLRLADGVVLAVA